MTDSNPVLLPPLSGAQLAAWEALFDLAPVLGDNWTLIGGQMVLIHQAERAALPLGEAGARFSLDLDVVIDVRAQPRALSHTDAALVSAGFEQDTPDRSGTAHRYRMGDAVIDVLAPDHIGPNPPRLGIGVTLGVPGGTQALQRTEAITVQIAGATALIRRPNLIGAIIIKAKAATSLAPGPRGKDRHFGDLNTLVNLLTRQDYTTAELTKNEQKLLKTASSKGLLAPETISALISLANTEASERSPDP